MSDFDTLRDIHIRQEMQAKGPVDFMKYLGAILDWRREEHGLTFQKAELEAWSNAPASLTTEEYMALRAKDPEAALGG